HPRGRALAPSRARRLTLFVVLQARPHLGERRRRTAADPDRDVILEGHAIVARGLARRLDAAPPRAQPFGMAAQHDQHAGTAAVRAPQPVVVVSADRDDAGSACEPLEGARFTVVDYEHRGGGTILLRGPGAHVFG